MNTKRSAAIIHDLTTFALPPQLPSDEMPELFREGFCRICGDREPDSMPDEFFKQYRGERECEIFNCALELTLRTESAECACCGEIVIAGRPCWAYLTAWYAALDARPEATGVAA